MTTLPDDVTEEILLRLPTKPLIRFKRVSKQWLQLITSNRFVFRHYNLTGSSVPSKVPNFNNGTTTLFMLHLPRCYYARLEKNLITPVSIGKRVRIGFDIDLPMVTSVPKVFSVGFGVYCVYDSSNVKIVSLWNPATREIKELPIAPYYPLLRHANYFGNLEYKDGYFSYKVGRITAKFDASRRMYYVSLELYSSKTSSWTLKPKFCVGEFLGTDWNWVNLNGRVHWMFFWDKKDLHITTFDYESEVFGRIGVPLPLKAGRYEKQLTIITQWDEKYLCLLLSVSVPQEGELFLEVWVMLEYGVEDSWIKAYTVGPISEKMRVLGFSSKVQGILLQEMRAFPFGSLLMFDCKSSVFRECVPAAEKKGMFWQTVEHTESLVSLP